MTKAEAEQLHELSNYVVELHKLILKQQRQINILVSKTPQGQDGKPVENITIQDETI